MMEWMGIDGMEVGYGSDRGRRMKGWMEQTEEKW